MNDVTREHCAVALDDAEPGARDRDRELRRLEDKKPAGAELVMTQPVFYADVRRRSTTAISSIAPVKNASCAETTVAPAGSERFVNLMSAYVSYASPR